MQGLALLKQGNQPAAVVDALLAADGNFEGQGTSYRQIGVAGPRVMASAFTGAEALASPWAGTRTGLGYSVQGNGLVGETVVAAMQGAFLATRGALAERLLRAVEAGEAVGGQSTGRMSAALLVRTREGGWQDVDLRVDADPQPVTRLRYLFNLRRSQEAIGRAERAWRQGRKEDASRELVEAERLGADWDRVWRRAARLCMDMGDNGQALHALETFVRLNPVWGGVELSDPIYTSLQGREAFTKLANIAAR